MNHILHSCHEEPGIFPYIRQYYSTLSLLNNPDTESYQNILSQPFHYNHKIQFEPFNPNTSIRSVAHYQTFLT